jgi:hypothetical protein
VAQNVHENRESKTGFSKLLNIAIKWLARPRTFAGMLFSFGPHSSLLLPFAVPGLVATGWLLLRAARRRAWPDAWLALLIVVPTLSITQWMLGFAGWYDSHDGYSTAMFYVPWQLNLLLGPATTSTFVASLARSLGCAGAPCCTWRRACSS